MKPGLPVIKRLFHASGGFCAFASCDVPVIDADGDVIVEVAHIRAAEPGGPRYDAAMTDEQRHGFENLLLLCGTHHKKVDKRVDEYPVDALLSMKEASEHGGGPVPDDEALEDLRASLHEIVVTSINQTGGQTAGTINNISVSSASRHVSAATAAEMLALLRRHRGRRVLIWPFSGNPEAANFAREIAGTLASAGLEVDATGEFMFFGNHVGLKLTIGPDVREEDAFVQDLLRALRSTGEPVVGNRGDMPGAKGVLVQVWPAG